MSYFKKDEYIVVTNGRSDALESGYVFKQRREVEHLSVYKDLNGAANGWGGYQHYDTSNWRYATPEEIAAYDRNDAPCHIDEAHPIEPQYEIY